MLTAFITKQVNIRFSDLVRRYGDDWRLGRFNVAEMGSDIFYRAIGLSDDSDHTIRADEQDFHNMRMDLKGVPVWPELDVRIFRYNIKRCVREVTFA